MTPTELKQKHEVNHPDSKFFSKDTMSFFGDTMSNFGCYEEDEYWILYRKRRGRKNAPLNHYKFSKEDFDYKGVLK